MASKRRTAALVVSAFVEPGTNPAWYARISFYVDTFAPAVHGPTETSIEGVCKTVQAWLESVIDDPAGRHDGSVTAG